MAYRTDTPTSRDIPASSQGLLDWFVARHDVYAEESQGRGWFPVRRSLTQDVLVKHLQGADGKALGTYVLGLDSRCKFICFDLDTLEPGPLYALVGVLTMPYVVEHTGGRGRHVWQFFAERTPAEVVRRYGTTVLQSAGLWDEARGAPAANVEVYPKQDALEAGGLGNLIRLPFGVHASTGATSHVEFGEFGCIALRDDPAITLSKGVRSHAKLGEAGWLADLMQGEAPDGRNNGLNRLRFWLQSRGFTGDIVEMVVRATNDKFPTPVDEDELSKLLRRRG